MIRLQTNHSGGQSPRSQKKLVIASFRLVGGQHPGVRIRMTTLHVTYKWRRRLAAIMWASAYGS